MISRVTSPIRSSCPKDWKAAASTRRTTIPKSGRSPSGSARCGKENTDYKNSFPNLRAEACARQPAVTPDRKESDFAISARRGQPVRTGHAYSGRENGLARAMPRTSADSFPAAQSGPLLKTSRTQPSPDGTAPGTPSPGRNKSDSTGTWSPRHACGTAARARGNRPSDNICQIGRK